MNGFQGGFARVNVEHCFQNLYRPLNARLSARTVTLYGYSIRKYGQYLARVPTLADFDNLTVGRYLQSLIESGLAISSVNKERRQLLALWRAARDEGLLLKGPRLKPLPEPDRIPRALSVDQLIAVRKATCTMPGLICAIPSTTFCRNRTWTIEPVILSQVASQGSPDKSCQPA